MKENSCVGGGSWLVYMRHPNYHHLSPVILLYRDMDRSITDTILQYWSSLVYFTGRITRHQPGLRLAEFKLDELDKLNGLNKLERAE